MDTISNALGLEPLPNHILDYIYSDIPDTMSCQKGELNSFYGKKHSEETKEKIRQKALGRKTRIGKKHSEETKEKIRQKALGRTSPRKGVDPWNKGIATKDETKQKISEKLTGLKRSDASREKIKEAAKNRPKMTCPHCNKNVDSSNYHRWHGDNCKHV